MADMLDHALPTLVILDNDGSVLYIMKDLHMGTKRVIKDKLSSLLAEMIKCIMIFTMSICDAGRRLRAQGVLNGSNMAEFQLGNIPGVKPSDQTSLYDQLNLSWSLKEFSLKTRVEQFYPSFGEDKDYTRLSQYSLRYAGKNFHVTAGHFYNTLGRGLLLRTYEIPASIWETRGYRVRYGFYRDIHGVEAGLQIEEFCDQRSQGKSA